MRGITLPLILTVLAIVGTLSAYRALRRGGARFYTLEREAILRQAGFTLIGSMLLFLAAVGLLIYERQQFLEEPVVESGLLAEGLPEMTTTPFMETQPPTPTPTPTPDPDAPPPVPTAIICRGIVEGTGGNGLTLRDVPGGERLDVLAEGSIVTVLHELPVVTGNITWVKVRSVALQEGFVALDFLVMNDRSCIEPPAPEE
jgi:hypothetical protein